MGSTYLEKAGAPSLANWLMHFSCIYKSLKKIYLVWPPQEDIYQYICYSGLQTGGRVTLCPVWGLWCCRNQKSSHYWKIITDSYKVFQKARKGGGEGRTALHVKPKIECMKLSCGDHRSSIEFLSRLEGSSWSWNLMTFQSRWWRRSSSDTEQLAEVLERSRAHCYTGQRDYLLMLMSQKFSMHYLPLSLLSHGKVAMTTGVDPLVLEKGLSSAS